MKRTLKQWICGFDRCIYIGTPWQIIKTYLISVAQSWLISTTAMLFKRSLFLCILWVLPYLFKWLKCIPLTLSSPTPVQYVKICNVEWEFFRKRFVKALIGGELYKEKNDWEHGIIFNDTKLTAKSQIFAWRATIFYSSPDVQFQKLLNYSHISAQFCYLFWNELLISTTISTIIYKKSLICGRSTISNVTPTPIQCAAYWYP